ncbi:hypothetical protein FA15DRAFT_705880 [Coprinopsis marcescibilis]|uniref:Fungal-type protein kinase domain-containing protein n=1 Tax=Coprinopsis marcescibilis TaxID=230819 RepID=A0A5C3KR79_COPMA|nr:hypothetical protein FA15DRAFT_705880 [Coprinopsis marcescibilis]
MSRSQPRPANSKGYQSNGATPRKAPSLSANINAKLLTLPKQRDLRMDNVRKHTFSCPSDEWFLAFLADDENSEVWSDETASKVLRQLDSEVFNEDDGWVALSEKLAEKPIGHENDVYSTLDSIYKAIVKKAQEIHPSKLVATTSFRTTPNDRPQFDVQSNDTRPDGQSSLVMVPADISGVRRSSRIAEREQDQEQKLLPVSKRASECAGIYEFKKDEAAREDNNKQMVFGASQLFYNDPRRRFTYGMTIEKTSTRLWFFNHSFICTTDPFDCNENPEALIRWFLYMTFANETQLGFDPTVKRLEKDKEVFFRYQVNDKYYRTIGNPIAEDSAWLMNSRAVRVWTVRLSDVDGNFIEDREEEKEEHVLKDVWLYDDIPGELENQNAILKAAKDLDTSSPVSDGNETREKIINNLFLTIMGDCIVQIGNEDDITAVRPANATNINLIDDVDEVLDRASKASASIRQSEMSAPNPDVRSKNGGDEQEPDVYLKHHRRIHRRIVFREKCKPFYEVGNLELGLHCLVTYAFALNTFREIGYLHRDISFGNCLVFVKAGQPAVPKISDLEYCKKYNQISEHDPTTGTPEFMATEVRLRDLLFTPAPDMTDEPIVLNPFAYMMQKDPIAEPSRVSLVPSKNGRTLQSQSFHFHYYHDLEGVVWLFVWLLLSFIPQSFIETPKQQDISEWRGYFNSLFQNGSIAGRQRLMLAQVGKLKDTIKSWGWYDGLHQVIDALDCIPKLVEDYKALEKQWQDEVQGTDCHRWSDDKFRLSAYQSVWTHFARAHRAILLSGKDCELKSVRDFVYSPKNVQTRKGGVKGLSGGLKRIADVEGLDVSEEEKSEYRPAKRANTREG